MQARERKAVFDVVEDGGIDALPTTSTNTVELLRQKRFERRRFSVSSKYISRTACGSRRRLPVPVPRAVHQQELDERIEKSDVLSVGSSERVHARRLACGPHGSVQLDDTLIAAADVEM